MRPKKVSLYEVSPRDGLQNEKNLPLKDKIALIQGLADAGVQRIESGSFVSPQWIPQMADSEKVIANINRTKNVTYSALIPNLQGLNQAINTHIDEIAIFTSASETFNQRNINCSIDESLLRFVPLIQQATLHHIPVRAYLSCTLGCPYEGSVSVTKVTNIADTLYQLGVYEISLSDTIGIGTAYQAQKMVEAVSSKVPLTALALHFHDTYGQGLANILACLDMGITTFDASVAGLGGCPYAKGASGNVASEDLIYLLHGLHIDTGIDLQKLIKTGNQISHALGKPTLSKVAQAMSHQ